MLDLIAQLIALAIRHWPHRHPPMPNPLSPTAIAQIAAELADLYPDVASLRRLLATAELDAKLIPLDQPIVNAWHAAVTHAQRQDRLALLIQLAIEEYPLHSWLLVYHDQLTTHEETQP